jgi:hypothetical protein
VEPDDDVPFDQSEAVPEPGPQPAKTAPPVKKSPPAAKQEPPQANPDPTKPAIGSSQAMLEQFVTENGYNWDIFARWGEGCGVIPNCTSLSGFGELGGPLASRMLRAKASLLTGLMDTSAL